MTPGKVLRIVHLEDDPRDAELIQTYVETEGIRAVWVTLSDLQGLERALDAPEIDLVLSDYSMPSFDGLQALDTVRSRRPDVPFIFVSGTIGEERAVEAIRRGATDYVLKDRLARLGVAIRRALKDTALRLQRKLVEEQLHKTYEQHRRLMAASPTIIYSALAGEPPRITFVSENVRAQLGYEPALLTDEPDFWVNHIHPADRAGALPPLSPSDSEGPRRYRFRHANGAYRWIEDRANLSPGLPGSPAEILGSWTDITHQRQMDEERARLEDQFHHAQKMEAIGALAGGVAHDFNNVLTVILGYCEVLLMKTKGTDRPRAEIHEIQKAGNRAAGLAHQLLAFSRKQSVQPRPIQPAEAVRSLHKMIDRLISENIDLEMDLTQDPDQILCDPTHLDQILVNLIVNARDAMPRGGRITIGCRREADDTGPSPDGVVVLWVSDTGVGIPPEHMDRIFDPFFTTKPPGKGTGLGLAMVWGAVKQNGGRVEVESHAGKGTTFRIVFPLHRSSPAVALPEPSTPPPVAVCLSVLLAEDNESVRAVTARMLEALGHKVVSVDGGEAALEAARAARFDLVLTDVVMRGMNGTALVRELRRARPDLPAVFCTGYLDDIEHLEREQAAADPVVHKPFDRDTLSEAIHRALRPGQAP